MNTITRGLTRNIVILLALLATLAVVAARAASSYVVVVEDASGKQVKQVSAASDGSFEIRNLKAGVYRVKVKLPWLPNSAEKTSIASGKAEVLYDVIAQKDHIAGASSGISVNRTASGQPTGFRMHKPCVVSQNWSVVDDNLVIQTDGSTLSGKVKVIAGKD